MDQLKVQQFREEVVNKILPSLDVVRGNGMSLRTARRWLVKLGWRHTVFKRGVYMDGHERDDVKEYRQSTYIPKMREYEK